MQDVYSISSTMLLTPQEECAASSSSSSSLSSSSLSLLPVCCICGESDSARKKLCHFRRTERDPHEIYLHVFCGKTAAILPQINMPALEILSKSGIKNKHGTKPSVQVALQKTRAAVLPPDDYSNKEQAFYLVKEFEAHLAQLTSGDRYKSTTSPPPPTAILVSPTSTSPPNTTWPGGYSDHSPQSTMDHGLDTTAKPMISPESVEPATKKVKRTHTDISLLSPYEIAMERLQQVSDQCGGVGYSLVRGVSRAETEDDYDEEDEDNFDPKQCSQSQVDHVRVIIVTQARQNQMESMIQLVLQEQCEETLKTFDTSFSNQVLDAWNKFKGRYRNSKSWSSKFDMLVGFTDAIKDYNVWMHDHEVGWGGEAMVAGLARMWKTILTTKTDQEIGIDAEFTRPGVIALLEKFKEDVESVDTCNDPPMLFAFL